MATFTTEQGLEYVYNLPNSKIDEEEGAEYGLILSRDEIENARYDEHIISFLKQLPHLRIITEKDFIDKTKPFLIDFFENNPIDVLNMNSHWIKKFIKKNYQILKYVDSVFDILVEKNPSFCSIDHYLLFSILGRTTNEDDNYQSNYTLYRKIKDPSSTGKSKKVLHSVCTFNFYKKELIVDALCVNNHYNFKGAGNLLNVLMDMCVPLNVPKINLGSVNTTNTMVFYIKNGLVPKSLTHINKITGEVGLTPMYRKIDIRLRPNWKLTRLLDKSAIKNKTLSYTPAEFTISLKPLDITENTPYNPNSEKEKRIYEKYSRIVNFIKSTVVGIKNSIYTQERPHHIFYDKDAIQLFKEKLLEVKMKNQNLVKKHDELLHELKIEFKKQLAKPKTPPPVQVVKEKKTIPVVSVVNPQNNKPPQPQNQNQPNRQQNQNQNQQNRQQNQNQNQQNRQQNQNQQNRQQNQNQNRQQNKKNKTNKKAKKNTQNKTNKKAKKSPQNRTPKKI